jgi:hypothetical protein
LVVLFLVLRGTAERGALKANPLPGGARCLAVRAVKSAEFAFIGAKRENLARRSGRLRQVFQQEGQNKVDPCLLLHVTLAQSFRVLNIAKCCVYTKCSSREVII